MTAINSINMKELFASCKTIAVVGLSNNTQRPSYGVSQYLQRCGYRIIPVNPSETEILGEKCYAGLKDIPIPVDVVDVFRNPDTIGPIVEDAIAIGAQCLWLQEGVVNQAAAEQAAHAGLDVVMDRCMLKVHRSLT